MRLTTLGIIAFGHFTNETLTFDPRPGVLDVVYGDNEAGKSTSLRAVTSFLYGIPPRTMDDFLHPMPTLRIGATVAGTDGRALSCVRRKGLKDTLRDENDAPFDASLIEQMLGGLNRDLFEQMYALSREQLQLGSSDLLSGNGALGEALFGASLGLTGINDVLKALEEEAADIFRPNGHNPKLNKLLAELDLVRKRARDAELRPTDYHDVQNALDRALEERDEVEADLIGVEAALQRARRNQQLIPLVARRERLLAELEDAADAPVLATTAREERIEAERELQTAGAQIERDARKLADLRDALAKLPPRGQLLARSGQIRDLHKNISAHQKAARDLPGIQAAHRLTLDEASALLGETHPDRALPDVGDLRPSETARASMNELGNEYVRLTEAKHAAEKAVEDERRSLARARTDLESLPVPEDVAPLRGALEGARRLGEIEVEIESEEMSLTAVEDQLALDIAALGFDRSLADLESLAVSTDATVARFAKEEERNGLARTTLTAQICRIEGRITEDGQALAALELAGAVPTETDLDASRGRRGEQWQVVRAALDENPANRDGESTASAAGAYEESVRDADEIADRLRREADRVATKASFEASMASSNAELDDVKARLIALDAEVEDLAGEWRALWAPAGIAPRSAPEMREWLADRASVVDGARSLRAARARHEGRVSTAAHHRQGLGGALERLGRAVPSGTSLAATIAIAEEDVEEHANRAGALKTARERIADAEHREREATEKQAAAETALDAWRTQWAAAMTKLDLGPELKPDQARRVVESVEQMFVLLRAAAKDKARIDGIERDTRLFKAAVSDIVAEVAPDLAGMFEDSAVAQLHQMLNDAQTEAKQAELVEAQVAELEGTLEEVTERQRKAGDELARLMRDARCSTVDDIAGAEERSSTILRLRGDLLAIEEQMMMLAGASLEEVTAQVQGLDPDFVHAELQQLEQRKRDLSQRRQEVGEEVGHKRTLFDAMHGDDDAAELHSEEELLKAEIRMYADQYARLRLSAAILRRQIDDFRERSHGPLLLRAGHFFSNLTRGSFVGLATGFDKGNVVLLGRRRNGRELMVEQMSTGTRDQLYLALRLATLEQQAQQTDALPLIVDDLFEGYDDKRAAAGFEALAEVAEKTQVIFFTHHHHLVEIAQETLSAERCVVQDLEEPGLAAAAAA